MSTKSNEFGKQIFAQTIASISIICFLDKLLHAPPHIDTSPLLMETSLNYSVRKNERQQNPEAYLEHFKKE